VSRAPGQDGGPPAGARAVTDGTAVDDRSDGSPAPPTRGRRTRHALTLLALLAALVAIDTAAAVLLPVLLGGFLALLLNPAVRWLSAGWLPRALAAALVVSSLIGGLLALGWAVHTPAMQAIEQSPRVIGELKQRVQRMTRPVLAAGKVSEALEAIESIGERAPRRRVEVVREDTAFSARFGGLLVIAASVGSTLVLVYLFLVYGEALFRRAVTIAPTLRDKRTTVAIVRSVQSEISRYVGAVTLVNLALGAATAAALHLLGVRDALLWGLLAALLNFVPYIGPLVGALVLLAVGLLQFDTALPALAPAAAYLALNVLESQLVTPMVLGRNFALNPVVIVLWLLFWGWLWGALGLLLAMPMLVCAKIVCGHSESLRPWALIIER
jgi:predicted PurR-regulated permease PerM